MKSSRRDRSGVKTYFIFRMLLTFTSVVVYGAILPRRISLFGLSFGYPSSVILLAALCMAFALWDTSAVFDRRRADLLSALSIFAPLEICTLLAYGNKWTTFTTLLAGGAALLAAAAFAFAAIPVIREGGRKRLRRLPKAFIRIVAASFAFVFMAVCVRAVTVYFRPLATSAELAAGCTEADPTLEAQIDTLVLLEESRWRGLSASEKLKVLNAVKRLECERLGLDYEPELFARSFVSTSGLYTAAAFTESRKRIDVNIRSLGENGPSSYECVCSIAHEVYHAYQHCCIEAMNSADERYRGLYLFKGAAIMEEEFADYNDGTYDYEGYASQYCEYTARAYGESAAARYKDTVDCYIANGFRFADGE